MIVTAKVSEIRKGDMLAAKPSWTALTDALLVEDINFKPGVTLEVRYADGGNGFRHWDDRDIEIEVIR